MKVHEKMNEKRKETIVFGLNSTMSKRQRKIPYERSFAAANPKATREWHPTLNGTLQPTDLYKRSVEPVFFQCETCQHIWQTKAYARTIGQGCPACARRALIQKNKERNLVKQLSHMGKTHPEWVIFFDEEKNKPLTIEHVTKNSCRKIYWKCPYCQQASLIQAKQLLNWKKHQSCLHCHKQWLSETMDKETLLIRKNHMALTHPQWLPFFDQEKNNPIKPTYVTQFSVRKLYWKCPICQVSTCVETQKILRLKVHQYCRHCGADWAEWMEIHQQKKQ